MRTRLLIAAAAIALLAPTAKATSAPPTTTTGPTTSTAPPSTPPATTAPATTAPPTTAPPTTAPPTTAPPTTAPPPISADAIRAAKVGWSRFVADNFATPNAINDPCPLLAPDAATSGVEALGLVASALPYGVALYRDQTGAGIIGVRCGVDLAATANPAGSTGFAIEATLLDGQAVFPQYVVRVAGQNTPITPAPEIGGETIARCRFEPTVCVASWHNRGLVVTVRLDGPRTDASEAQTGQLLAAVARRAVANLATVAPPP